MKEVRDGVVLRAGEEYPIFSLPGPRSECEWPGESTAALPHLSIPGWWEAWGDPWKSQNQDGLGLKCA